MKILCVFGEHNYGDPKRGTSYEYSNFLPALQALGHEVVHFDSWSKTKYSDFFDLNQSLLGYVQREVPDVIFFVVFSYEIWIETLISIRKLCTARLINWSTDDSWRFDELSRLIAPYFDLYVSTYATAVQKAKTLGHDNFHLSQWAASASQSGHTVPAAQCRYEVSFVGTAYGARRHLIENLVKAGIRVECFGFGWPNGPVSFDRMREIIRESVVSLNFSDPGKSGSGSVSEKQIKARVFEVLSLGGFVVSEYAPGLERYFIPNQEIVVFEDTAHLVETVKGILADTEWRDRIARQGHNRVLGEHTYECRFREILAVLALRPSADVSGDGAMSASADLKRLHRMTLALHMLKMILVLPLVPFFGPKRARRAARRLVYGASWRLFGVQTYNAKGLPGRMFYSDS